MTKLAMVAGQQVEVVTVVGGWTTIINAAGKTEKVRNGKVEPLTTTEVAVSDAIAEQAGHSATDSVAVADDKNHPAPVNSLAAQLLSKGKQAEAAKRVLEKSGEKKEAKVKAAKPTKPNPFNFRECPECGSGELYVGEVVPETGIAIHEDKIIGCHHCDWEVDLVRRNPKLEPKMERYVVGLGHTASGRPTIDRNDYVANKLRGMDVDLVYPYVAAVLAKLEVEFIGNGSKKTHTGQGDLRARYSHLNVGMQRMNMGNLLRGAMTRLGLTELPEVDDEE